MLDVHPPHHPVHAWRDFFIHIATIVVGLLIAVGLEQTVEYFHHRHEVAEFHQQIQETFQSNLQLHNTNLQQMGWFRAYLADQLAAVEARRSGHPLAKEPAPNDARMNKTIGIPSLAPYESAKQDGTVALLSSDEIRLYNRMAVQREFYMDGVMEWFRNSRALESFEQRFVDSKGSLEMGSSVTAPDLSRLSPADLLQYESLLATEIKGADLVLGRDRAFTLMCRAVLDGAHTEDDLIDAYRKMQGVAAIPASPAGDK